MLWAQSLDGDFRLLSDAEEIARDRRVTRQLRGRGSKVIHIWQHSLQKSPNACLNRIHRALTRVGLAINMLRKTVGLLTPAPA